MASQSATSTLLDVAKELVDPNDFSSGTWMALGAALFLGVQLCLPDGRGTLLPILYLGFIIAKTIVKTFRLPKGGFTDIRRGRWTAKLSDSHNGEEANSGSDGIVMFILVARINHPMQKLAPGSSDVNEAFKDMWREVESNRNKWGYLGRTNTLTDTSDSESTPMVNISYWKDLNGLHEFARSSVHLVGQNGYFAKKYPYMGIMHETLYAPKGCWEAIYHNFPPWGLGATKEPIEEEGSGALQLRDVLERATKRSTMFNRMGRERATG